MKIAFVGTVIASVLGFRADLIKRLIADGHEVLVFCIDFNDTNRKIISQWGAIPVDYSLARTSINPLRDLYNTWILARTLRKLQPDIVFSYFVKPVIFGTLAAALAGVKQRIGMLEGLGYVFTDFPNGISIKQNMLRMAQLALYRCSFPFLHRLIFLNHDDPVDLISKYNLKVKKVSILGGIGVNLNEYIYTSAPAKSPPSFIFVGRLLAEKGIYEYIAAAKKIKTIYPKVSFIVLGGLDEKNPGGLSRSELQGLVATNIVEYPGHVDNVKDWLANASVFVLPSYYREGVPRSIQEAMAIGRAIITTDMPGCRDTVIEGVNGFLVPRWDVDALVDRMLRFINKPTLVQSMGQESYRIAQDRFNVENVNKRLISLLGI